ncbi:MAG TPA: hypothetical protein VMR25_00245 [Planctomycetaceae bacterium]|nr:hypothetical protein [Planctomycetaceae bacterium]
MPFLRFKLPHFGLNGRQFLQQNVELAAFSDCLGKIGSGRLEFADPTVESAAI